MNERDSTALAVQAPTMQSLEKMGAPAVTTNALRYSLPELKQIGEIMYSSGMFKDLRSVQQAMVKLLAGAENGYGPFQSLRSYHVIDGKPVETSGEIAARIKRSGKYRMDSYFIDTAGKHLDPITEADTPVHGSVVLISEIRDGGWFELEPTVFTLKDAAAANLSGKQVWKQYARDMLFARTITAAARRHCADIFGGPIYTPEEFGAEVEIDGTGDMRVVTALQEPPPLPGPTPREQAHLDAIEAVLAACRQGNVKAPARGVLDGKSVVELLAYRDRVLAARAGDSKPAGAPPASQPTQEPLAAAASATEPANASEFPGPGGPPMSLKTQRHLFAVLGELGYDTKQGAHRGWLSSLGLGAEADAIESFALLSEAQAAFLARKAVEERDALKWECPACGTFDKSKHSANCPERDFTA